MPNSEPKPWYSAWLPNLNIKATEKFDINASSKYDQSTYLGRCIHFYAILDPRTLLTSQKKLESCIDLLKSYTKTAPKLPPNVTNDDLWEAKRITDSVLHPDTKQPIPAFARFSAFAPVNIPITLLLLYPGGSVLAVFSQWINQSYNVCVNYFNRNASNPMDNTTLLLSYSAATLTSCTAALGLRQLTNRLSNNNPKLKSSLFVRSFIPFSALVLAGWFNVILIRNNELTHGINVYQKITQPDGTIIEKDLGKSQRAGKIALAKCCMARLIWSIPPMFFPPIIMKAFINKPWYQKSKLWKKMAIETGVIGGVLLTFIPPSLALFPQKDSIKAKWLEPELLQLASIKEDTLLYFNKGL